MDVSPSWSAEQTIDLYICTFKEFVCSIQYLYPRVVIIGHRHTHKRNYNLVLQYPVDLRIYGLYAFVSRIRLRLFDSCSHDTFAVNGPICSVLSYCQSYKKSPWSANRLQIQQNVFSVSKKFSASGKIRQRQQ